MQMRSQLATHVLDLAVGSRRMTADPKTSFPAAAGIGRRNTGANTLCGPLATLLLGTPYFCVKRLRHWVSHIPRGDMHLYICTYLYPAGCFLHTRYRSST